MPRSHPVRRCAGGNLVLAAGKVKDLAEVDRQCTELGAKVASVTLRPSSEENCNKIIEAAVREFGGVDILVVASGKNDVSKIAEMSPDRFLDVMDANVTQSC